MEGVKDGVVVLLARTLWALGEEGRDVAKGHLMEWYVAFLTIDSGIVQTKLTSTAYLPNLPI